ncbi:MAG TPA: hypothetical protein VHE54_01935 [Puia sp.]|nr:hypothetical protein [Puia sp.]
MVLVTSCKKTIKFTDTPNYSGQLTDFFMPMKVGKFAIYRLDSLNFYFYGQLDTVTAYIAKDSVEDSTVDAAGRPTWIVTRYLSDTLGATGWNANISYLVTPSTQRIEVLEDNLRFVKLAWPISQGFSWQGNTYLPYAPYQDFFDYNDDAHLSLDNWNYSYQQVDQPFSAYGQQYDSTLTVQEANDSINASISDPNSFGSRTYWTETYAKHVGLVYRHTELWEYQPPTPDGTQTGYKIGFKLTQTLLQHN